MRKQALHRKGKDSSFDLAMPVLTQEREFDISY